MTSLTTSWSPNSCQLRLAFHGRRIPPVVFVRKRLLKLDHRFRLFAVAENTSNSLNSYGLERRRSWNSWVVNSNSAVNGFAGWNTDEQSGDTPPRQSLQGERLTFWLCNIFNNCSSYSFCSPFFLSGIKNSMCFSYLLMTLLMLVLFFGLSCSCNL